MKSCLKGEIVESENRNVHYCEPATFHCLVDKNGNSYDVISFEVDHSGMKIKAALYYPFGWLCCLLVHFLIHT